MANKKIYYPVSLLVILLSHIVVNFQILKRSSIPRIYDEGVRIQNGIEYFYSFFCQPHPNPSLFLKEFLSFDGRQCHPHLFEFLEAVCFKILYLFNKMDIDLMLIIINSFFLLILLVSVYKIGSILYDRNTGLLSAFLLSFFPLVFGQSRVAMLDYPLMCMVSLSVYFLLETKAFYSFFYSALAGIAFGIAQLIKEAAVLFILPVLIYYFIKSYQLAHKKKAAFNFIITVLFFIIISGAVYLKKENLFAFKIYFSKIYYIRHQPESYYYVKKFINTIGPFIFFLSLPLILSYAVHIKKREKLPLVWFLVPLLLFSLSFNKSLRFLLPILPAFALIIGGEIKLGNWFKPLRAGYGFSLTFSAVLQYALLNYGFLTLERNQVVMERGILSVKKEDKYNLVSSSLLQVFKKEIQNNQNTMRAIFLFDIAEIRWPIKINAQLYKLPYEFHCSTEIDDAEIANLGYKENDWREQFLSADYIIDKSGDRHIKPSRAYISNIQNKAFEENKDQFKLIARLQMPDGSAVYVYKKVR